MTDIEALRSTAQRMGMKIVETTDKTYGHYFKIFQDGEVVNRCADEDEIQEYLETSVRRSARAREQVEDQLQRQAARDMPKGMAVARFAKALYAGEGNIEAAAAFAQGQDWRSTPAVQGAIKSLVAGSSTVNTSALLGQAAVDFSGYVRPQTLLGRIKGMRQVPLRTRLLTGTGGTTAYWVGESQAKPISKGAFQAFDLEPLKVTAIVIETNDLLRFSSVKADITLQDDLAAAAAEAIDAAFIDPYNSGVANVKPASISYGITPIVSSGNTGEKIETDLKAMMRRLINAGSDLQNAVWVMSQSTALNLGTVTGGVGYWFPGVNVKGGTLMNLDVHTTRAMPQDSAGASIILFDPQGVAVGDDDGLRIDVITQGSIVMDNAPVSTATSQVSLWQTNSSAIRVERHLNWKLRRTGFVAVLNDLDL